MKIKLLALTLVSTIALSGCGTPHVSNEYLSANPQINYCLNHSLICLTTIYDRIYETKAAIPNGPFPCVPIVPRTAPTKEENFTFTFLLNISSKTYQ